MQTTALHQDFTMPIDDKGDILVSVSNAMRVLADSVVEAYRGATTRSRRIISGSPEKASYDGALSRFLGAVYQENPHLDPSNLVDSDGKKIWSLSINIDYAKAKPLNDLLEEAAKANGSSVIRPFDEGITR
jgi:hypothetical protein